MLADVSFKDVGSGGSNEASTTDNKSKALKQIAEEQKALSKSCEILDALLAKTNKKNGISITNINISNNDQVLAGLFNTDSKCVDACIIIDNVTTKSVGQGVVSIVNDFDMSTFFKKIR